MSIALPNETQYLSPTSYKLHIEYLQNITFYSQRVSLPGVSLGFSDESNPHRIVPLPGDTLEYEVFTFDFIIDDKMENYKSVYEWMTGLSFPQSRDQYRDYIDDRTSNDVNSSELSKLFSRGTLQILDANNRTSVSIDIVDMFPIYLGQPQFDSTQIDFQYVTGRADFKIDHFKFLN